jgi:hypothetical protein
MTKKFIKKPIDTIRTRELSSEMYINLFGVDEMDRLYDESHPEEYIIDTCQCDQYEISIEYMETILNALKAKGANYVSIEYNSGHFEYKFMGHLIEQATDKEIEDIEKAEKQKLEAFKLAQRENLLKQLENLENEK